MPPLKCDECEQVTDKTCPDCETTPLCEKCAADFGCCDNCAPDDEDDELDDVGGDE